MLDLHDLLAFYAFGSCLSVCVSLEQAPKMTLENRAKVWAWTMGVLIGSVLWLPLLLIPGAWARLWWRP
jgi:hypothetical protein